jgi:hypothetical protein
MSKGLHEDNFGMDAINKPRKSISGDSVADPGPVAFLTPGSGMGKKSRSGSVMNIPDNIFESLETIFWVENT